MSDISGTTSDINIDHTELWSLELHITGEQLKVVLYSKAQADSLISRTIALDLSAGSQLKAVEAAIYDHQLLLSEFKDVSVVVDSQHFVMLPPDFSPDDTAAPDGSSSAQLALDAAFGTSGNAEVECAFCQMPRCGAAVAFEVPKGLDAFLRRTFFQPRVVHRLYPLCEHFARLNEGSGMSRLHINYDPDGQTMDMVAFSHGRFAMANTFTFRSPADAAFYALHAWSSLGFDSLNDEVQITGSRAMREATAPMLRKYVSYVMPAIFPAAAMRIGHDAVKAPLELILLALCE